MKKGVVPFYSRLERPKQNIKKRLNGFLLAFFFYFFENKKGSW